MATTNRLAGTLWRVFVAGLAAITLWLGFAAGPFSVRAQDETTVSVVASFSILADIVHEVGGDYVDITTIVPRQTGVHVFKPAQQHVYMLDNADMLVSNGLGFESWLPLLLKASAFDGEHVMAAEGVEPRRLARTSAENAPQVMDKDDIDYNDGRWDPHAWHDLKNGMLYAQNIADALIDMDPEHKSYYKKRLKRYLKQLERLEAEMRSVLHDIPVPYRRAITAHDAFAYFGQAYGIEFMTAPALASANTLSEEDAAELVDMTRHKDKVGVFTSQDTNSALVKQLEAETNAPVGGPLFADTLADKNEPAGSYVGMFHWNAGQLISTLKPKEKGR